MDLRRRGAGTVIDLTARRRHRDSYDLARNEVLEHLGDVLGPLYEAAFLLARHGEWRSEARRWVMQQAAAADLDACGDPRVQALTSLYEHIVEVMEMIADEE